MIIEDLSSLPSDHPARNLPLADIGAHYQLTTKGQMWHEVKPFFGIAKRSYNDLGDAWIKFHIWKAVNYTGEQHD